MLSHKLISENNLSLNTYPNGNALFFLFHSKFAMLEDYFTFFLIL